MQMTSSEIVTSYKQAKNPGKQIKILAELNATTTDVIKDILARAGVIIPKQGKRRVQIFDKLSDRIIFVGIAKGKTAAQIAAEIGGVSEQQVAGRIYRLHRQGKLPTTEVVK